MQLLEDCSSSMLNPAITLEGASGAQVTSCILLQPGMTRSAPLVRAAACTLCCVRTFTQGLRRWLCRRLVCHVKGF